MVTDLGVVGWHSPGHARHHVAWELDGQMFTGDTAGARLPGSSYLSVTAAPPQFDPAAYDLTLERLAERDPQRLWLTHGGPFEDAGDHLRRYRRKVAGLFAEVKAWRHSGLDDAAVRERYHDRERRMAVDEGLTVKDWQAMELMNPTALSTDGMLLFLDRDSG